MEKGSTHMTIGSRTFFTEESAHDLHDGHRLSENQWLLATRKGTREREGENVHFQLCFCWFCYPLIVLAKWNMRIGHTELNYPNLSGRRTSFFFFNLICGGCASDFFSTSKYPFSVLKPFIISHFSWNFLFQSKHLRSIKLSDSLSWPPCLILQI